MNGGKEGMRKGEKGGKEGMRKGEMEERRKGGSEGGKEELI